MLSNNKYLKYFSILCFGIFLVYLIYIIYGSFFIIKNQFTDIGDSTYVNQVDTSDYTKKLANFLTKDCKKNRICEVQKMLDFVTNIPYKINNSVARSSKNVVAQNFGDCDDKSNLLISLLKAKHYKAYFVLVPKHIFVIVSLNKKIINKSALYLNNEAFYILESTAKESKIGFPLKYSLKEIEAIIDPFKNKQIKIISLNYL